MNKEDAKKIIKDENLTHYNFFEDRKQMPYEIVIKKVKNQWIVYKIDERESIASGSEQYYDSETTALDDFIKRLRAGKLLSQLTDGKYY